LEDLDAEVDINSDWETIRGNIKLRKHKPWFDKGWTKLSGESKQVKLQQLQILNEINGDNLKDKINELH
jgi:hypothetical protein